ncbi:MAG TPA: hypothetical protein VJT75_13445 [Thermoleophilaceae bacterium]|nr:hypothetical protein [Thermoleophilaceae bacterium]
MKPRTGRLRLLACGLGAVAALAAAGCGGTDAKVGDCIDSGRKIVDCGSKSATKKLVSEQSGSTAIACVQIGDKPQTQVEVGGDKFCAESK